jgi:hypothetical protein
VEKHFQKAEIQRIMPRVQGCFEYLARKSNCLGLNGNALELFRSRLFTVRIFKYPDVQEHSVMLIMEDGDSKKFFVQRHGENILRPLSENNPDQYLSHSCILYASASEFVAKHKEKFCDWTPDITVTDGFAMEKGGTASSVTLFLTTVYPSDRRLFAAQPSFQRR